MTPSYQTDVQWEEVDVAIGRIGGVCDGVCEAVCGGRRVAETGCGVEGLVGEEAETGLLDSGILGGEVTCAGRSTGDVASESSHHSGAGCDICGAGVVEGPGDAEERFRGLEEGVGVLVRLAEIRI